MDDSLGYDPPAKQYAREEARRKGKLMADLLALPTLELFEGALRLQGIEEGSEPWNASVNAWREHHRVHG